MKSETQKKQRRRKGKSEREGNFKVHIFSGVFKTIQ
jgi:hypothetical protein